MLMQRVLIPFHAPATLLIVLSMVTAVSTERVAFAEIPQPPSEKQVAERAKDAWENGALTLAIDVLDEWLENHPASFALHKLRGDILATARRNAEAVQAYDKALAARPDAIDVRWAKWSVLVRWGQGEDAVAELQRLARVDARNPLIQLRLVQELRKLDRLEASLEPYQKAVDLAPDLLSWRLGLARARFDVLDYIGAIKEVRQVLQRVPPGSPLEVPARNLLTVITGENSATDRGRRATVDTHEEISAATRQEWAAIRGEAWRLFSAGRYQEAEPVYRHLLALNPSDSTAAYHYALTLMQLGKCHEALEALRAASNLDLSEEEHADIIFRKGQCLVELERWEEAFVHFQILYDAAVEFEASTKGAVLPAGMRVPDKDKLARWLDRIRPHVPDADRMVATEAAQAPGPTEDEIYAKVATAPLTPHAPLETRASLMGRDADFSWFRYVIPAAKVMRDDFPTGDHQFIPIQPTDTFPRTQRDIYLVFGLVSSSYDAVPLATHCFLESDELTGKPLPIAHDEVTTSMSDQSGYFRLSPPESGWKPGLYRCALFAGERATADTQVDEVRFRIVEPATSS
jgi:tetratricopeptide (TPR) repeat protein